MEGDAWGSGWCDITWDGAIFWGFGVRAMLRTRAVPNVGLTWSDAML